MKHIPIEQYEERMDEIDDDLRHRRQVTITGRSASVVLGFGPSPFIPDLDPNPYGDAEDEEGTQRKEPTQ